jgi:hypothetical protein
MSGGAQAIGRGVPRVAAVLAVALVVAGSATVAYAGALAGPKALGIYTATQPVRGAKLSINVSVTDPASKVGVVVQCAVPKGSKTVSAVWTSGLLPLHGGSFSYHGTAKLTQQTMVLGANYILKPKKYTGAVSATGSYNNGAFTGKVSVAGSPCSNTSYTAKLGAASNP